MSYFKKVRHKKIIGFFLCSLILFSFSPVFAQLLPTIAPAASSTDASLPQLPMDDLGRNTPKSMIQEFLKTVKNENYEKAAQYLDLSKYSRSLRKKKGPELAKGLQTLLDQGGELTANKELSDSRDGKQDDGLDSGIDLVGKLWIEEESFSLLVKKSKTTKSGPIWQFSKETVKVIPDLLKKMAVGPLDSILPKVFIENKWSGVPVGHWVALLTLVGIAVFVSWLLTSGIIFLIRFAVESTHPRQTRRVLSIFILPIRVYTGVWAFTILTRVIGVSIVARQTLGPIAEVITWLALPWLLWRIIDVIAISAQEHMTKRGGLSVIAFFRRSIKFFLAAVALVVVINRMGVDVTAGVAALGVGGLALAFGAQKTVENFVNSLTLIVEQPVRLGDFCKVGDITGTVMDIGMRSTRLKTLNRTVVTIPNGVFASLMIENYTLRDRFWFHPVLGLRYETTPDQIRYVLIKIREFLLSHPSVDSNTVRVKFIKFGASSLDIEVFAYIYAKDYSKFLDVQEDIMLHIMEIIDESGSGFAFPSQTLYMAKDTGLPEEKKRNAEKYVQELRKKGNLPLPDFDLKNTAQSGKTSSETIASKKMAPVSSD